MTEADRKRAAKAFAEYWKDRGDEKSHSQSFWLALILDARALYPDCSLADLYDEVAMSPELRKAHQANDRVVMQAYGFDVKTMTESTCVAELMKLYQKSVCNGE